MLPTQAAVKLVGTAYNFSKIDHRHVLQILKGANLGCLLTGNGSDFLLVLGSQAFCFDSSEGLVSAEDSFRLDFDLQKLGSFCYSR